MYLLLSIHAFRLLGVHTAVGVFTIDRVAVPESSRFCPPLVPVITDFA